jgi:hypothetical protein
MRSRSERRSLGLPLRGEGVLGSSQPRATFAAERCIGLQMFG